MMEGPEELAQFLALDNGYSSIFWLLNQVQQQRGVSERLFLWADTKKRYQ